jgi:hypothetical protein
MSATILTRGSMNAGGAQRQIEALKCAIRSLATINFEQCF